MTQEPSLSPIVAVEAQLYSVSLPPIGGIVVAVVLFVGFVLVVRWLRRRATSRR
jgi:hypothetical protein